MPCRGVDVCVIARILLLRIPPALRSTILGYYGCKDCLREHAARTLASWRGDWTLAAVVRRHVEVGRALLLWDSTPGADVTTFVCRLRTFRDASAKPRISP